MMFAGNNAEMGSGQAELAALLNAVATGSVTVQEATAQLASIAPAGAEAPQNDTAILQANFPEVVWGEGKTASQIAESLQKIANRQGMAAATRVSSHVASEVQKILPECEYNSTGASLTLKLSTVARKKLPGTVALITAGTANPHVIEECRVMLQATGCYCFKLPDAGVMGMHRVVENLDAVRAADVVICVTGMDGGVASVVAGMVECPVISLPTSTGYGAAMNGLTPLMAALTSSAPGVTVVNIDSGFAAAMAAWRIMKNGARIRDAMSS